jgi:hypothetical protein
VVITVAVEGDTDVPFVTRLCEESGFAVRAPLVSAGGKPSLDRMIPGLARAAHGSPHLVVRDLDQDAPCAAEWMKAHRPRDAGPYFCLRLAVRAVEAWFLADRAHAARSLHLTETRIPVRPDEEADPKRTIVELARRSSKPLLRRALVPEPGTSRKAGPGYASWLLEASLGWSFRRALVRSGSLARAHERLKKLREAWDAVAG